MKMHQQGVKESCCTRCVHRNVCGHKAEFLDFMSQIEKMRLHSKTESDHDRGFQIDRVEYLEVVVKCKHERQDNGTQRFIVSQ